MIETNYAALIEALYSGVRDVTFEARIAYEDGTQGVLTRDLKIREVAA